MWFFFFNCCLTWLMYIPNCVQQLPAAFTATSYFIKFQTGTIRKKEQKLYSSKVGSLNTGMRSNFLEKEKRTQDLCSKVLSAQEEFFTNFSGATYLASFPGFQEKSQWRICISRNVPVYQDEQAYQLYQGAWAKQFTVSNGNSFPFWPSPCHLLHPCPVLPCCDPSFAKSGLLDTRWIQNHGEILVPVDWSKN